MLNLTLSEPVMSTAANKVQIYSVRCLTSSSVGSGGSVGKKNDTPIF